MIDYVDEDTGEVTCARCEATYLLLPGFQQGGHQCRTDGTRPEFIEK